jgi:hypothetical protein
MLFAFAFARNTLTNFVIGWQIEVKMIIPGRDDLGHLAEDAAVEGALVHGVAAQVEFESRFGAKLTATHHVLVSSA